MDPIGICDFFRLIGCWAAHSGNPVNDLIALLFLAIASVTIAVFLLQTLAGIARGQLKALA